MNKLTVGSDPEFFLRDNAGELVSAIGLLGGTKMYPRPTTNGSVQEDNVTAEVNSLPSSSLEEFIFNHKAILGDLKDILKPLNLSVDISGSALFSPLLLSHPMASVAGCTPDFNAWTNTMNDTTSYMFTEMRAAGGHLHIGSSNISSDEDRLRFCKALDLELGLPSVIQDPDTSRIELYGKAGSFRHKYEEEDGFTGLEYRVLSNYWMRSEELMKFVYDKISLVHDNFDSLSNTAESVGDKLISIINNKNVKEAKIMCKDLGVAYA